METKAIVAIVIVVVLVVGVNGLLYLMMRKSQVGEYFQLWQQASHRARKPWEEEDAQLNELSKLVGDLKKSGSTAEQEEE